MADFSGGDVSSQGNLYARDIITGIQKNFTIIFQQPFRPPNVGRPAAQVVIANLVETMQSAGCSIRVRREAGDLLGRLGWFPEPDQGDLLLAPAGFEPTGLDAFRPVPGMAVWIGKYPVTHCQFARFVDEGGYDCREWWSEDGWAWRGGEYDSKAPDNIREWLGKVRPPEKRDRPYLWEERRWNSPLYPVVGASWFEVEAYSCWLSGRLAGGKWTVRLPGEAEWAAAMGGQGNYGWGDRFDPACLNCADSWAGRDLADSEEWWKWVDSEERQEAGLTAVTTYPQGVSRAEVWDGNGNVWEWTGDIDKDGWVWLRGGSWFFSREYARVSYRHFDHPVSFDLDSGFRVVVAPVFS